MKKFIHFAFIAFLLINIGSASAQSKYEKARELYKQGPEKGIEIVGLLRTYLKTNPDDEKAVRLLGITLFGIEKFDEALPIFQRAIALTNEKDSISPAMLIYKARTLYYLGRKYECKRILEVYWAFWQGDKKFESMYNWYYPKVKDIKKPKNDKQTN